MTDNTTPLPGTPDAVGLALAPYVKGLFVVSAAASVLLFLLVLAQPQWAAGIADAMVDVLKGFYHEPEMDIT